MDTFTTCVLTFSSFVFHFQCGIISMNRWVIGPRGAKLLDIQLKSNCKAWLNQQLPDDRPRQLILQGKCEEDVSYAFHLVQVLIQSSPISMQLARSRSASTTLKEKQQQSPDDDATVASEGGGCDEGGHSSNGDNGNEAGGNIDGVDLEGINATVLDIPDHLLGLLIGKNGWTIKRTMKLTGARITINQSQQQGPCPASMQTQNFSPRGVTGFPAGGFGSQSNPLTYAPLKNKRVVIYGSLASVRHASEYIQALIDKGLSSDGSGVGVGGSSSHRSHSRRSGHGRGHGQGHHHHQGQQQGQGQGYQYLPAYGAAAASTSYLPYSYDSSYGSYGNIDYGGGISAGDGAVCAGVGAVGYAPPPPPPNAPTAAVGTGRNSTLGRHGPSLGYNAGAGVDHSRGYHPVISGQLQYPQHGKQAYRRQGQGKHLYYDGCQGFAPAVDYPQGNSQSSDAYYHSQRYSQRYSQGYAQGYSQGYALENSPNYSQDYAQPISAPAFGSR